MGITGFYKMRQCGEKYTVSNTTHSYIDFNAFAYRSLCTSTDIFEQCTRYVNLFSAYEGENVMVYYDSGSIDKKRDEMQKRVLYKNNIKYFPEDKFHAFELFPIFAERLLERGLEDVLAEIRGLTKDTIKQYSQQAAATIERMTHLTYLSSSVAVLSYQPMADVDDANKIYEALKKKLNSGDLFTYSHSSKYNLKILDNHIEYRDGRIEFDKSVVKTSLIRYDVSEYKDNIMSSTFIPERVGNWFSTTDADLLIREVNGRKRLVSNGIDKIDDILSACANYYYSIDTDEERYTPYFVHMYNNFGSRLISFSKLPLSRAVLEYLVRVYSRVCCSDIFLAIPRLIINVCLYLTSIMEPTWTFVECKNIDAEFVLSKQLLEVCASDTSMLPSVFTNDSDTVILLMDIMDRCKLIISSNGYNNILSESNVMTCILSLIFMGSDYHRGVRGVGETRIRKIAEGIRVHFRMNVVNRHVVFKHVLTLIKTHCMGVINSTPDSQMPVNTDKVRRYVEEINNFITVSVDFYKTDMLREQLHISEFKYLLNNIDQFL